MVYSIQEHATGGPAAVPSRLPLSVLMAAAVICGGRWENRWSQPALIRQGGYGATESFLVVGCDCGALAMTYRHASSPRSAS